MARHYRIVIDAYVLTACIIFKTPPTKYFAHGVLNIMQAVNM